MKLLASTFLICLVSSVSPAPDASKLPPKKSAAGNRQDVVTTAAPEVTTTSGISNTTTAAIATITSSDTTTTTTTVRPAPVVFPPIISPGGVPPPQVPGVWEALDELRGNATLSAEDIQLILATAVPGEDYPILSTIPATNFSCANVKQAGFYADVETRCQVIRRCDIFGTLYSYLCPNQTVFNQITLVCHWFFDVNCAKSLDFYDYSNARLYHEDWVLLDTPPEVSQNSTASDNSTTAAPTTAETSAPTESPTTLGGTSVPTESPTTLETSAATENTTVLAETTVAP